MDPAPHPLEVRVAEAARARDATLDAATRSRLGVVHTSPALCRYALARADVALRASGVAGGLRDRALTIVDPAAGTGAFLASALALGARGTLLGFERDDDARAIGAETLGQAVRWVSGDTLASLPEVDGPVLVVGNPPWVSGWAKHAGERSVSDALLADFRVDLAGAPLREKKIGVLSDAYLRFLRWAAELVIRADEGALALLTNSSYLDGAVHRGVRGFLASRFEAVEITDLGGNALVARDGSRDDNLFGVRPGVALTVARRLGAPSGLATVAHARLRGAAEAKLEQLADGPEFATLAPTAPSLFFVPTGRVFPESWVPLPELFPFHREGLQTNRDSVVVDVDRERLLGRMQAFALGLARPDLAKAEAARSHYDPEVARAAVRSALGDDPAGEAWIRPLAYRPFDRRWVVTLPELCHRPRPELWTALDHGGWALLTVRRDRGERPWNHVAASIWMADNCFFSSRSSCRTRVFPAFDPHGTPNLGERARASFGDAERALAFALCWLSAPAYRARYDDALRRNYPRLPLDTAVDDAIAAGRELAAAFVQSSAPEQTISLGHRRVRAPSGVAAAIARCDTVVAPFIGMEPSSVAV